MRVIPISVILAALVVAGAWSVRVGLADYRIREKTFAGTEQAIGLAPDNAEYTAQLALLIADDDPQKAGDVLWRAVSLNPYDARSWIDLGLRAERAGDAPTARRCLLRAADADREFPPRWTLANYYFRHDDAAGFWFWAKESLAIVADDVQPVFRLCGRVEEDGKLIDRLDIRNPEVRSRYLSYLLDQKRVDLIGPALGRLLDDNRDVDAPLLLTACDRLLDSARVDEAADLWKRMAKAGRVPSSTFPGDEGQILVNGNFTTPPISQGFDWRVAGADGIGVSREGESQGLRITFSGSEPEECEVLAQLVPVQERVPYELQFTYRTDGIVSDAGLIWRIVEASGRTLREGPSLASEAATQQQLRFETPAGCRLVRLSLRYRRAPGTTRMEGFVVLRNLTLRPEGQAPPTFESRVRK